MKTGLTWQIRPEPPDSADAQALVGALDAWQDTLYPPEARYALDLTTVDPGAMCFLLARDATGQALACGAVVLQADHGEVKRMWVTPAARGQGLARQLLQALEAHARAAGCPRLLLETGPRQPAAIALYRAAGFEVCGPFGSYPAHPLSVFMGKTLAA